MKDITVSFPIKIRKFKFHEQLKTHLLTLINNQTTYENVAHDNTDITRCDWPTNKNDFERPWITLLKDPLIDHLTEWANERSFSGFNIKDIWFQQYATNSVHDWHIHPNCHFTNVYYLDLPKGSPKTEWIDPLDNTTVHQFDVEEGDIITFPNILVHKAPVNESTETKTIISWNLDVTFPQTLGDHYGNV